MDGSRLLQLASATACALSLALFASQALAASLSENLRAARRGDARAQYIVGTMYLFGQGARQDIVEGSGWIDRSARAGQPEAVLALAQLYDVGQGVPQDSARSDQLRRQAAKAGIAEARGQIEDDRRLRGQRDFRRASILMDLKRPELAIPYAKLAAASGSGNAELLLGRAYHFQLGVPLNLKEAFAHYRRSADLGHPDGIYHLAYMYYFGVGTAVDRTKALASLDRASKLGDKRATRAAAEVRSPNYGRSSAGGSWGGSTATDCGFNGYSIGPGQCARNGGSMYGSGRYDPNNPNVDIP